MNKFDAIFDCNTKKILTNRIETTSSVKFKVLLNDELKINGNLYEKKKLFAIPSATIQIPQPEPEQNLVRRSLQNSEFIGLRTIRYLPPDTTTVYIREINNNLECETNIVDGDIFSIPIANQMVVRQNELQRTNIRQALNNNLDLFEDRIFLYLLSHNEYANHIVANVMSINILFEMIESLESQPTVILIHPMFLNYLRSRYLNESERLTFAGIDVILNPVLDRIYVLTNKTGNFITFENRRQQTYSLTDRFSTQFVMTEQINMVISKNFSSCRIQNVSK